MLIVQISDTHIVEEDKLVYRAIDANEGLRKAVAKINAMSPQPDYVICTGDLTNRARPAQFEVFGAITSELKAPFFVIPGNHDDTPSLHRILPHLWRGGGDGHPGFVHDHDRTRLVFIDSTVPGEPHGELSLDRRDWLRDQLENGPDHILIFLHHPPFETGIWWMDAIGASDGIAFEDLLKEFDNVRGVFAGHIHRPISRSFANTYCHIAPSTSHQVALDIRDDDAMFMSETFEPAGMLVHCLDEDTGRLMTHVQYCDTYQEVETLKGYVDEHREKLQNQMKSAYQDVHGRDYDGRGLK